jgi:hypothetical protein
VATHLSSFPRRFDTSHRSLRCRFFSQRGDPRRFNTSSNSLLYRFFAQRGTYLYLSNFSRRFDTSRHSLLFRFFHSVASHPQLFPRRFDTSHRSLRCRFFPQRGNSSLALSLEGLTPHVIAFSTDFFSQRGNSPQLFPKKVFDSSRRNLLCNFFPQHGNLFTEKLISVFVPVSPFITSDSFI